MDSTNLVVYAFKGYQAYWLDALIHWYSEDTSIEFQYVTEFPRQQIEDTNFDDTYHVMLFGVNLVKSQTKFLNEQLGELTQTPFTEVYAFGEQIDQEVFDLGFKGLSSDNMLPDTLDFLEEHTSMFKLKKQETDWNIIDVLKNAISFYNDFNYGKQAVEMKVIADVWKEDIKTYDKPTSSAELKETFGQTIKRGKKDMQNMIELTYKKARHYQDPQTKQDIIVIYADYGYDEIASRLMDKDNMIFLFIKHTAGDDMVHIRTSNNLNALEVARTFRPTGSYGNSKRAYLFLSNTPGNIGTLLSNYYFNK